ncbi:MAG TPA: hypothetical protein VII49_05980 [Rhizomicrobium sp.]
MKRRDTVLRNRRFQVEEFQRRLAILETMRTDLEGKLADLEDNVARERQRANDSDIGRLAFPSFLRSIEARRNNLHATVHEIARERAQCQAELATASQELKILELVGEQQSRRAAEAKNRSSHSRPEQLAPDRHLRKHALRQV